MITIYIYIIIVICCMITYTTSISTIENIENIETTSTYTPEIQLAFGIMTYQKQDKTVEEVLIDFHRLMEIIYTENNHLYVLHIDIKSNPTLIEHINNFCELKLNCIVIKSRNIAWAGLSTGEMMLTLMQTALEYKHSSKLNRSYKGYNRYSNSRYSNGNDHNGYSNSSTNSNNSDHDNNNSGNNQNNNNNNNNNVLVYDNNDIPGMDWSHFVLIGHESLPLVSLPYIVSYIFHHDTYPKTNYINCWKVNGYDFFGQWEDNIGRLQDIVIDDLNGYMLDLGHLKWAYERIISHLKTVIKSILVDFDEKYEENDQKFDKNAKNRILEELPDLTIDRFNIQTKRQPPPEFVFYKSIQLMVVSREFVE